MTRKNNKIYEFEEFRLDAAEQILLQNGEPLTLTPKVFDLLVVLIANYGHLLSKDELIKALWAESFVEEANLNVTVSALRRALGEKPNENRYIETVPRRGYRFVAEVREITEPNPQILESEKSLSEAPTISTNPSFKHCPKCHKIYYDETLNFCLEDGENLVSDVTSVKPPTAESFPPKATQAFRRRNLVLYSLGGLVAVLIGVLVWQFAFQPAKTEVSNIKTIAVLPFKPLTKEKADEALEIGMADALITKLSSLEQVMVRPTSSVSKFSALDTDPITAGKELQVEAVLDGKIQRADNKIRVSVQLLRVSDGAVLWAGNFDDFFTNIFAMQDSISEKMTTSLSLKLSGKEKKLLTKRFTENTEAYALFLKGKFYHEKLTMEGSRKAIELYEEAVQKDPEYAMVYAWSVGAFFHLAHLGINREENLRKARENATKAVNLDPNLPEAHESLATVYDAADWNFKQAEIEYKKAIELDPNNADAHFSYSTFLSRFKHRHDESIREIEIAKKLNPLAIYMQTQAVTNHIRARRYDEGIAQTKEIIEQHPDFHLAYFLLTRLYVYKSMPAEANAALKKHLEINPNNQEYIIAYVHKISGKKDEAEKILRELTGKYKEGENYGKYALIYNLLGDKERTLEFLEKALQRRENPLLMLDVDPEWDEIRSDPRFQDLVKRVGLVVEN